MKIGIIGLGLIGASLGRAIIKKTENEVYGYDVDRKSLETAYLLKAIHDEITYENIKELDILILAVCPRIINEYLEEIPHTLKPGCIVMDAGGNKKIVCDKMKKVSKKNPHLEFIGCHPMAGREFSGIAHSTATLFERASNILVPVEISIESIAMLKALSYEIGFNKVVITTSEEHDSMIAFTSQLAHIVSNAYVRSNSADKHLGFSAGSFRDMTRVAKMNSFMWAELMTQNREHLIENLEEFIGNLDMVLDKLRQNDEEGLQEILEEGNKRKLYVDKLKGDF